MNYSVTVKNYLMSDIDAMASTPEAYALNPGKDFTRHRKISFKDLVLLPITMEAGTMRHELYKYFNYQEDTLSNSAYCQQRNTLAPETFKSLLQRFNSHFPPAPYKDKYQLMAADGCTFTFTRNPEDTISFYGPDGKSTKGFNQIHTVALYDLISRYYVNAKIQPIKKKNEFKALAELIDEYEHHDLMPIFIADRGFFAYNVFAHAIENKSFFLIRAKDKNMMRLTGSSIDELPDDLDISVTRILTRSASKKNRKQPDKPDAYRHICKAVRFDYLPEGSKDEYEITLRVLRFKITDSSYENIVTNLPVEEFSADDIKDLYNLRWGIETSFRELKHILGTGNFRSKKREYIEHEIWAKLILYNFCSVITQHVVLKRAKRKYEYQVNFTVAFNACHYFIRIKNGDSPPNIEGLIRQNILPIRPGRNYARQHRFQIPVSFAYRF